MPTPQQSPSAGAKICIRCQNDCSNRPRTKDAAGRYTCQDCVNAALAAAAPKSSTRDPGDTPDEGMNPLPLEPAGPAPKPPKACPSCGRRMSDDASVCANCGFNEKEGLKPAASAGAKPDNQAPGKSKGRTSVPIPCPSCGYDIRGLTQPKCPECGEVITDSALKRQARKKADSRALMWAYLTPLIITLLGLAAGALVAFRTAEEPEEALIRFGMFYGIRVAVAFLVYCACASFWVGFASSLHLTALQVAAVMSIVEALREGSWVWLGFIMSRSVYVNLSVQGVIALIGGGVLMKLMDLDFEDASIMMPLIMIISLVLPYIIVMMLTPQ